MTASGTACHLLVVDACTDTQARILEQVQGRGFSIVTAPDPVSALATIDTTAPDVVITDLFLPEGGGLALAQTLRARHEPCPVIIMGQDEAPSAVLHALRAGAVDYLPKPVAEEELAHALERARHLLPADLADTPGVRRSEYRLTVDSDPAHIPGIVSWLIKTTASTLPETRRLHLRSTLHELLYNAVEHGNLEITYQEKQRAISEDRYEALIEQRLAAARFKDRSVVIDVLYDKASKTLRYRIADSGAGFKWRTIVARAQDVCPSEDVNGRGIFLAKSLFADLTYNDRGNEVTITVPLD